MSSSRSATTSGVIQPPHSLSLGKAALSSTTTYAPLCLRRVAAAEPAGPPPTPLASALRTPGPARTNKPPSERQLIVFLHRQEYLKQIPRSGFKSGDPDGQ